MKMKMRKKMKMVSKKLGLTSFLFRQSHTTTSAATTKLTSPWWAWPSCKQRPRTDSFRLLVDDDDDKVYKGTVKSAYDSSSTPHSSEETSDNGGGSESLTRGLVRSMDRLLFEPWGDTRSILGDAKRGGEGSTSSVPFKESVAMAMESDDPYLDFKKSMEEMAVAQGMEDWGRLEELLAWYLSVNGKKTHAYIAGAFLDLLVGLVANSSSGAACSS